LLLLLWLALLAGAGLLLWRGPRAWRFLLLWLLTHTAVMTYAVLMAPRHYYLPLAPALILISALWVRLLERATPRGACRLLLRWPKLAGRLAAGVAVIAAIVVAGLGAAELLRISAIWGNAAATAAHILEDTRAARAGCPQCRSVYMVNLPDGLPTTGAEVAYIFRAGTVSALYLAGIAAPREVSLAYTPNATWTWDSRRNNTERLISLSALQELARRPDTLVMRYLPERGTVVRMTAP
jgi:hypothetical protein